MKTFQCTCAQPLFFHNTKCLACGLEVAYDPTLPDLRALTAVGDGTWALAGDTREPAPAFRFCEHRTDAVLCNWLVPADEDATKCLSCRLTRTIPDLSRAGNPKRLAALESAKRELLYSLLTYGLPIDEKVDGQSGGLAFDFLESIPGEAAVLTGHSDGLITINVAEADGDYREQHREAMHEPYRTLLGHFRHEVGHHYWDVMIRDTEWLPRFRELFGDERADYGEALARHYAGVPADWQERFISSYASSHPWEDWAESWAHYMHMRSTLETAASYGIDISRVRLLITPFERDVLCSWESDKARADVPRVGECLGDSDRGAERHRSKHGPASALSVRAEQGRRHETAFHPVRDGRGRRARACAAAEEGAPRPRANGSRHPIARTAR